MRKVNGSITVMRKEIKLLFKSKRRIFLLFLMPIMILFGGIFTAVTSMNVADELQPVDIWVIDEAKTNQSNKLIQIWNSINMTRIEKIQGDYNQLVNELKFDVLVYIPQNFSSLINQNLTSIIFISYNENNTLNKYTAIDIYQVTESYDASLVLIQNPNIQFNNIDTSILGVSENKDDVVDEGIAQLLVIIPVYIIFFVVITPISLVLISVTIEREQKTLEVLFLQPVSRRSIVMGKILYGLSLVGFTLLLDIISVSISIILVIRVISNIGPEAEGPPVSDIANVVGLDEIITFFLGIAAIAIIIISLAVFLSLLAKDEKEANMISGIIPMLIMGMVIVIFVVPITDMGFLGQFLLSIMPVLGVIVAIYLSTIAGGVIPLAYAALVAQAVWSIVIITMTAKVSEAESILELSYSKVFKELKRIVFKNKVKL